MDAPGGANEFLWDFKRLLRRTESGGDTDFSGLLEEFGDLQSITPAGGSAKFYEEDALSNMVGLENSGGLSDQYVYRAFGQVYSHTGSTDNPATYVGRQGAYAEPDLGLYLMGGAVTTTRSQALGSGLIRLPQPRRCSNITSPGISTYDNAGNRCVAVETHPSADAGFKCKLTRCRPSHLDLR